MSQSLNLENPQHQRLNNISLISKELNHDKKFFFLNEMEQNKDIYSQFSTRLAITDDVVCFQELLFSFHFFSLALCAHPCTQLSSLPLASGNLISPSGVKYHPQDLSLDTDCRLRS
ncbi:hypothetical protein TNIN_65441 [Trichonephila inaurata madagascariensis]|uniref:Uncharacterized protein n=1 Tax=Trichonephila inaurata madagascariensis TaxID=2747483 RepID=A0A8X7CAP2_9ARAC|nr:hypothetical protein TNIN_65441 [Trichonephila inaurata madagascariensis]